MHVVEEMDLVSFYQFYIDSIRRQGFRLLILALIRDADAPGFYEDLRRYWSSLNDVTGRHALFVVAGSGASRQLQAMPIASEQSWTGFSMDMASPTGDSRIDELRAEAASLRLCFPPDSTAFRANTRRPGLEAMADANTGQVGLLSRALGLTEADVPCLHLSLLQEIGVETAVLPISALGDFSIYAACKEIIRRLAPTFEALAVGSSWKLDADLITKTESLREAQARLDGMRRAEQAAAAAAARAYRRMRGAIRDATALVAASQRVRELLFAASPAGRHFLQEILAKCEQPDRKESERTSLFRELERHRVSGTVMKAEELAARELLAKAFSSRLLEAHRIGERCEVPTQDNVPVLDIRSAIQATLAAENALAERKNELQRASMVAQLAAVQELRDIGSAWVNSLERGQWDYFISYPAAERELAVHIFRALEVMGRPFLDHYCLRQGDHWPTRIPSVQAGSKMTIAVISHATKDAHFQLSEIHRAINLVRASGHRLLPVYTSKKVATPFGLEQVHGIFPASDDGSDLVRTVVQRIEQEVGVG